MVTRVTGVPRREVRNVGGRVTFSSPVHPTNNKPKFLCPCKATGQQGPHTGEQQAKTGWCRQQGTLLPAPRPRTINVQRKPNRDKHAVRVMWWGVLRCAAASIKASGHSGLSNQKHKQTKNSTRNDIGSSSSDIVIEHHPGVSPR